MKEAWENAGEEELARVFFESYYNDDTFNQWNITCTGLPGCLPFNQAVEKLNQEIKGTKRTQGLIQPGHNMKRMITTEFPSLVHKLSVQRLGVERHMMSDQLDFLTKDGTTVRDNYLIYSNMFIERIDSLLPNTELMRSAGSSMST